MAKDGPATSSTGYRYGGLMAFRSGLPPRAINSRRAQTDADLEAGEALANFIDYHARVKTIGQPAPDTQGVSPKRAAVLRRMQELQEGQPTKRRISLSETPERKIELVSYSDRTTVVLSDRSQEIDCVFFFLVETNKSLKVIRVSRSYRDSAQAIYAYRNGISWQETYPLKKDI